MHGAHCYTCQSDDGDCSRLSGSVQHQQHKVAMCVPHAQRGREGSAYRCSCSLSAMTWRRQQCVQSALLVCTRPSNHADKASRAAQGFGTTQPFQGYAVILYHTALQARRIRDRKISCEMACTLVTDTMYEFLFLFLSFQCIILQCVTVRCSLPEKHLPNKAGSRRTRAAKFTG